MFEPEVINRFRVPPGKEIRLKDYDPGWAKTKEMKELSKDAVKERFKAILEKDLKELAHAAPAVQKAADMLLTEFLPNSPSNLPQGSGVVKKMANREIIQVGLPDGYRLRYL